MYFDGDDVTDWDNEVVEIQMDTINTLLGSAVYSLQNAIACFCKTHTFKKNKKQTRTVLWLQNTQLLKL